MHEQPGFFYIFGSAGMLNAAKHLDQCLYKQSYKLFYNLYVKHCIRPITVRCEKNNNFLNNLATM